MKNNSTVFCGLGHHFNGSKSNDSLFKVQNIYILPKNNLNKNYFRFRKVTSTNQKERRKSTSHAEGKILYFEVLKRSFDPAYGRQEECSLVTYINSLLGGAECFIRKS
jgi:hypothetical protein